ncbi:chondroitin sulfate proteoglycan 5-like isoform X3 [Polyodon spathula]|uniref:chondroitin sulfate proteoglycan 5-like isoform X3 n=1 Tax=Polyodon spathula TaxID=7913 RepID=UPI001B7E038B|nr:chondroitin sulfate proteoglycan 5-like isoform X3 [Polyodon spathula]
MDRSQTRCCTGCWKFTLLSIVFILHLIPLCVHGGLLEGNTTLSDNKNNDSLLCLGCRSSSSSGAKAKESLLGEHKEGGPEVSTGSSWPTAREPFVWGLRGTKELGGTSTPLPRESQEELGSGDRLFKPLASTAFGTAMEVGVLGEGYTTAPLRQDATTTAVMSSTEISQDSAEKEHLIEVLGDFIRAEPSNNRDIQSLPTPDTTEIRLDFKEDEQVMLWGDHTDSPAQGAEGSLDFTLLDLDMQLRAQPATTPTINTLATSDILSMDYYDPFADLDLGDTTLPKTSSVSSAREVLGVPTSWTLPEVYDYFTPYDDSYPSTTEVYPDEDEYTTSDLEDENNYWLTTAPSDPWILLQDRGTLSPQPGLDPRSASIITEDVQPSGSDEDEAGQTVAQLPSGQGSAINNNNSSECRMGYVKHNFTCKSVCNIFPSYCFNGGQCYLVENTGVFCRCNTQDYIWHKGARCESVITEFQVMCIAIGAAAVMVLLLFMITVFFAKKLHLLKTENCKLRKRSKYRPPSEQHNDNFSLSTIAEGSHPNKTISRYTWECKSTEEAGGQDHPNAQNKLEDPVNVSPKEDHAALNIQNSLTPKHENNKAAECEENSEAGITIEVELHIPKHANVLPPSSSPRSCNVVLCKMEEPSPTLPPT